jgi:RNAse (barnase) inhibitor barstar
MNVPLPAAPDGVARLLARVDLSGVYALRADQVDAVSAATERDDLLVTAVDLAEATGKGGLMHAFAVAFVLPDWFGGNWDALADALGDLSWLPVDAGCVAVVFGAAAHRAACPGDHARMLEVLRDASAGWREAGVPFWVFVVADGPDVVDA